MNEWHDLFVATAGSSAALTGLIFVGVSINLSRILSFPNLPGRALLSIILSGAILIFSIVLLMPAQSLAAACFETLFIGACTLLLMLSIDISIVKKTEKEYKNASILNMLFNQRAVLPYLIATMFFLFNNEHGFYWMVVAFILSIIKAIADAWVLLIEINR